MRPANLFNALSHGPSRPAPLRQRGRVLWSSRRIPRCWWERAWPWSAAPQASHSPECPGLKAIAAPCPMTLASTSLPLVGCTSRTWRRLTEENTPVSHPTMSTLCTRLLISSCKVRKKKIEFSQIRKQRFCDDFPPLVPVCCLHGSFTYHSFRIQENP